MTQGADQQKEIDALLAEIDEGVAGLAVDGRGRTQSLCHWS